MAFNLKIWLQAMRLRTLPLAVSSIFMGNALSYFNGNFSWTVFILSTLTAILLQILSNLANDYGDALKGADNENRIGPARAVQSGQISPSLMKRVVILFVILSLIAGISLIYVGTSALTFKYSLLFLAIGLLCIFAAIKYTVGKSAYGYHGFGDLFVFLFFGLAGVGGSYFLQTHTFSPDILLPASSLGLLSAAVLNMNNLRDAESDKNSGKNTLVVKMGITKAKIYHAAIVSLSLILGSIYVFRHYESSTQLAFLVTTPLFARNIFHVFNITEPVMLDPQLKKLAIYTFIFALIFGTGLIFTAYAQSAF